MYYVFNNDLFAYIEAIVTFFILWILFRIVYGVLLKKARAFAEKTTTTLDNLLLEILDSIKPPFYIFLAAYFGFQTLVLSATFETILQAVLYIWIAFYLIRALVRVTQVVLNERAERNGEGEEAEAATRFLVGIARFVLWILAGLFILSNLGVEVTSLIAGLGIGGLAVAFALQNILADLFSSFAIYFDKPFIVGDVIKVGDSIGEVTKVGIKTTRVRSISGEELIFSNQELTATRIQNFGRLKERRIVFPFGVTYNTNKEKLEKIGGMVETIIEGIEHARFDRAHLKDFGDSALNYEVVYYVLTDDYLEYMDIQEKINLGLIEVFEKEGIEFAFPTQTIYLEK